MGKLTFKIDKETGTMQFGKGKGKLTVQAEKSTENRINKPEQFKTYKEYELRHCSHFLAANDAEAEAYRRKVGDID